MSYSDFISRLDPKVAGALKTASETEIEKLETASLGLTIALGGGFARRRVAMLYGSTSSGKSSLAVQSIGKWQKQGLVCAFVDAEGTYDKDWAARLGVNNDELILQGSKSSAVIESDIRPLLENEIDVLVIDSISDILPEVFIGEKGEMKEQMERKQIGSQAKAITALLNGIHYLNRRTAVIILSQTTTFIPTQGHVQQVPHGGQKAMFASSQIVFLNSSPSINQQIVDKVPVGEALVSMPVARKVEYTVRKNKLGKPFGTGNYVFRYAGDSVGIDPADEIISLALERGLIRQSGAWFYYGDEKWQGKPAAAAAIRGTDVYDELTDKILTMEGLRG